MSDVEVRPEIVLPSGEILSLSDTARCAAALDEVRQLESRLRELKGALTEAIVEESSRQGSKTLHFDGLSVEVKGGPVVSYDAVELREALREAGMPEAVLSEVVVETVEYKVDGVRAKQAARANPVYAAIVDEHQTQTLRPHSVTIRKA